jgi:hypothetical protein
MFGWDWALSNNLVKLLVLHFPDQKKKIPIASIMEAPGSLHHYYDPYIVSGHSDLLTFTH